MLKAALFGAILALTAHFSPAFALEISEAQIAQAKAYLVLTSEQERHWPRVASALRSASRNAARTDESAGAKRVFAAAGPLIRTLTAEQKLRAISLVRALGYDRYGGKL